MFSRFFIATLIIISSLSTQAQQQYSGVNGTISFFSDAPLEMIQATSGKTTGHIDAKSGKLEFSVPISTFQFEKSMMQEHFNDKYMESRRFPKASFSGIIANHVDLTQPGMHEVVVKGILNIHGVSDERTISGIIRNENNRLSLSSDFIVTLENHRIKVPEIVSEKIAEKIDVKLRMSLIPDQSNQEQAFKNTAGKGVIKKAEKQSL